ncbi:MAG: arginine--tRNA ligase [Bdellovibrio sp.]
MHDPLRKKIAEVLHSVSKQYQANWSLIEIERSFSLPPQRELGDIAIPCFSVAKALKKSPVILAQDWASQMSGPEFEATAAGPYINVKFRTAFLAQTQIERIRSGEFFRQARVVNPQRWMIEYSQPNTHKELHVGHMRNACLGLALSRLQKFVGHSVLTATFPGDVGTHVAKCLWYIQTQNPGPWPSEKRGEWLGQIYSKANLLLEDWESRNESELLLQGQARMTEILRQLERKSGPFFEMWVETRQWSVDLMKRVYAWLGVEFDQWYWESEMDSPSVSYVRELFQQGKLIESQGAIGMNLEDAQLGFCLLLKKDGTGLYATKDLELARRKFQDYQIEKSIYVVDLRQSLHFQQVFEVLKRLGFEQAKDCYHLAYNFVELPDGAMSSRKGNIVPITELMERMEIKIIDSFLHRYEKEWSQAEISKVAGQVANAAIKYGMLRIDTNKKIVFEMEEWLRMDGESGPFIQYAAARIRSLLRKLSFDPASGFDSTLLQHPKERALIQKSLYFSPVVRFCSESERISPLCTYLYELAQDFNSFYHEVSLAQSETLELRNSRLHLASAMGEIFRVGLEILGIEVPERM